MTIRTFDEIKLELQNRSITPDNIFPDFTDEHKEFLKIATKDEKEELRFWLFDYPIMWGLAHKEDIATHEHEKFLLKEEIERSKGDFEYLVHAIVNLGNRTQRSPKEVGSAINQLIKNNIEFRSYFE